MSNGKVDMGDPKSFDICNFIERYNIENATCPSMKVIGDEVGLTKSPIHKRIHALIKFGHVLMEPGKCKTIRVSENWRQLPGVIMPAHRKPDPEKYCVTCGARMYRKRYRGALEDYAEFKSRKYCNRKCMAAGMMKDNPTEGALRSRAIKFRGDICESCGSQEHLHIHHEDMNYENNDPSNLKTLCASCHITWHWAHGRPRRNGLKSSAEVVQGEDGGAQ